MLRDLHLAIRSLAATPVVTAFALLSLALTIGANSAVFSILNGLLLRTLPVHDPAQLVHVTDSVVNETGETRVRAWSYPFWAEIRRRPQLFEAATAWSFTQFNLSSRGETRFVGGLWADGGFFKALGVPLSPAAPSPRSTTSRVAGRMAPSRSSATATGNASSAAPRTPSAARCASTRCRSRLSASPLQISSGRRWAARSTSSCRYAPEPLIRGGDSALESSSTNFLTVIARLRPDQSLDTAAAALRSTQQEIRDATMEPWSKDVRDRYLTSPFTVVPAATGSSNLRRRLPTPAAHHCRHRRGGAAHWLRQPGQPAAGARRCPPP